MPKASPSGFALEAPPEPYAHFEAIRQAQKDPGAFAGGMGGGPRLPRVPRVPRGLEMEGWNIQDFSMGNIS